MGREVGVQGHQESDARDEIEVGEEEVGEEAEVTADPSDGDDAVPDSVRNRSGRWWVEVALVVTFYVIYSAIRNIFGSAAVSAERAYDHAVVIIDIEKAMGLFVEEEIQGWFLDDRLFLRAWNIYYGTLHFAVTIGVLAWLFFKFPARHRIARNSLACTTLLALIGFSAFPLMPPRLLGEGPPYGGAAFGGGEYHFVDTLAEVGGTWSFDSGTMQAVSNQFAAMPSLHFGWSAWCFLMMWPVLRHRWTRVLMALYPLATLFAIVVTANHYWIDAAGGAVVLAAGVWLGRHISRYIDLFTYKRRAPAG